MKNIFTEHPHSIGESYLKHLQFASLFGMNMVVGGVACMLHAIFPFAFQKTGSNMLLKMTYNFIERMPNVDDKVAALGTMIEQKKANSPKA